jgi:hypothetical protein
MPIRISGWIAAAACLAVVPLATGAQGASPQATAPPAKELAAALRDLLRHSLPPTLYESTSNWGHTREVPHAVRWTGQGLRFHPEIVKTARNDGSWRKIRVTTQELDRTLVFRISDLKYPSKDQITFQAFLSFQAGIEFEQQLWESGVRLYSGSTRARLRVNLPMRWEATMRLDQSKSILLPELVVRFRVLQADLSYDQLVVEHIAGIGGTGAKLLGDALHSAVKQARPSLERDLLAKANAAILHAGDTREIRLGLSSLLGDKK